ncbi:phage tail protein [Dickeya dianthicola]|uniref:phage tail protein n=1 Tax=Dickeya dianthicola TaxID=204039 RepID=UPI0003A8096A|nr:tail fiber protein [Dickeya dianthicola]MCI4033032.1 phage tail protein [Dickeya dianthicola]MCI4175345.1 phage tail protein [Dickeya dianthicola]MCI4178507.1 phage tail protein [Dickeya dianthicola]MCI4181306.1 phage tail protein [Dickeya dianthicola]MCI4196472.1 phage tail protein [Dickeya dianthicola]
MKRAQHLFAKSAIAAALGVGFFLPQSALACNGAGDEYIGSVCYMAIRYCPEGYLPADGRTLNVSSNQALYSLIGNIYGGTAPTTFMLPDLRGKTAIGTGTVATPSGNVTYTLGKAIGQETAIGNGSGSVTLAAAQVPPHTHPAALSLSGTSSTVSLPLSGSITNLPFNAVASLGVTGIAKIGSSTTTGRTVNLTDKSVLTSVSGPAALLYAPAGAANDRQLGPDGSVTGTASGSVGGTASGGQLSGSAAGTVTLPLTGTVNVGANVTTPNPVVIPVSVSVPVRDPSLPLTACIAVTGLYPVNPG